VEGLGALVAFNPSLDGEANVANMTAFADGVASGEVTRAVRDTDSPAGAVREGDWIGLSAAGIVAIEHSLGDAVCALAEALIEEDCELVTVLEGEGASSEVTDALVSYLAIHAPEAEVEVHVGGQPLYPYLLGCE
jgi:dihydroxyacetone kinase-like predicted kinase